VYPALTGATKLDAARSGKTAGCGAG
jgi:hypothetical protein